MKDVVLCSSDPLYRQMEIKDLKILLNDLWKWRIWIYFVIHYRSFRSFLDPLILHFHMPTLVHSKCKRSSLRSQCWAGLFVGFSNTVFFISFHILIWTYAASVPLLLIRSSLFSTTRIVFSAATCASKRFESHSPIWNTKAATTEKNLSLKRASKPSKANWPDTKRIFAAEKKIVQKMSSIYRVA